MSRPVVEIATVLPRPTAVVAETTTWAAFPALWPRLLDEVYAVVRPRPELAPPVEPAGGERWRNVMLYDGDDLPRVEIGVLVAGAFPAVGRVRPSRLPRGTVARTVHRGGYATLGLAHDAVARFATERGFALAGPRWEVYGHAPPGPAAPEIEICHLLVRTG